MSRAQTTPSTARPERQSTVRAGTTARLRVAMVYHFYAHYRASVMLELVRNGTHEWTLAGDTKDYESDIKPWDAPTDVPFIRLRCRRIARSVMWQSGVIRLACSRRFDAIVFLGNANWPASWVGAFLARCTGKRVYFWTHGWLTAPKGAKSLLRRAFYSLADGLLLYGHLAKQHGIAAGFPVERLHVIYNSLGYDAQRSARSRVSAEDERSTRAELFGSPDVAIAICTARLVAMRRLDLLIEAAAKLRDEGCNVALVLVGDGSARRDLERLAAERGVPVHFEGACYDEDRLARLIMSANVTVAPAKLGLTAIHSLAYGTPVVTHDDPSDQGPEWEAVLPGTTGSLYPRNDLAGLVDAMRPWLQAPGVARERRATCQSIIDRFYNPAFQRRAIERAVAGRSADDLFWLREDPSS